MLIFDLVTLNTQRLRARRADGCVAHRRAREPDRGETMASTAAAAPSLELRYASLADAIAAGFTLVDVRDARERDAEPVPAPSLHLPMTKLLGDAATLDFAGRYLLVCATGKRSTAAADLLRSQGIRECHSLRGGLKGLKTTA
jgi:adenylyltransferase/sulfurtransferase